MRVADDSLPLPAALKVRSRFLAAACLLDSEAKSPLAGSRADWPPTVPLLPVRWAEQPMGNQPRIRWRLVFADRQTARRQNQRGWSADAVHPGLDAPSRGVAMPARARWIPCDGDRDRGPEKHPAPPPPRSRSRRVSGRQCCRRATNVFPRVREIRTLTVCGTARTMLETTPSTDFRLAGNFPVPVYTQIRPRENAKSEI